jgi:hypothetical protein
VGLVAKRFREKGVVKERMRQNFWEMWAWKGDGRVRVALGKEDVKDTRIGDVSEDRRGESGSSFE